MPPLPKALPPFGADRPIPPLPIERRQLGNGMQVWVVPRSDGPPKVHFVLAVRGGLADDPPLQPGFSSVLAAMLKEGTTARDANAIAQEVQSWGGDVQVEAGLDGITLSVSALASANAKAITLLSEMALSPAFSQEETEQAKLRALQALLAAQADPDWLARAAMGPLVYPGHPYGHVLPNRQSLLAITPAMLHAEHDRRFRPDRALLVITGRVSVNAALRLADAVFGDWSADGKPPADAGPAPGHAPPARVFVERDDSVQSVIRVGRPAVAATSPDYYPLLVAQAVLGDGFSSRLNLNLREDKGWTYGAGTVMGAEREGGAVVAYANVRNAVTGAAVGQFLAEFARLGDTPVPAAELTRTRHYLIGSWLLRNQLQGEVAEALADEWLAGQGAQAIADYVPRLEAVTIAQVQAMARKHFTPADASIVVVGDPSVLPQLAPYGSFSRQSK